MPIGITRLGYHVPDKVIPNTTISAWTGAHPTWIEERTGILERRYANDDVATSDLAVFAARQALAAPPKTIDDEVLLTIVGTSTPDQPQPATAATVQDCLGLTAGPAFDVNGVCNSFLFALTIANGWLRDGTAGRALVIGADKYSGIMDRADRRTVSLFGDGAGAAVLGTVPAGYGIRASRLVTDGTYRGLVEVQAGGSREPLDPAGISAKRHLFRMDGRPVKEFALRVLPKVIADVVSEAELTIDDINHFVLHQGNTRLVEALVREMCIDERKAPLSAPYFGNTAAASIPLTLARLHESSPITRGSHVLLAGVGGGMTAGAVVLTWY